MARSALSSSLALVTAAIFSGAALGQGADIILEGPVPIGGGPFFDLPFEVPEGIREIEVFHRPLDPRDVLDWGLEDPSGFRGHGGHNLENAVVGDAAASRSYLPGPIPGGRWKVTVGKAKLVSPQPGYRVEIVLRSTPTLAPARDRVPYDDALPIVDDSRFFAGDFHVHSEDSGDARARLDEIAAFAASRGLDFVVVTDHNTSSHVERLVRAQERNPEVLFVPGVELSTYAGHATGIGATSYVDHRIGHDGRTIPGALADFQAQGALFSINHPVLDVGDVCMGCAWTWPTETLATVHAVEIETGGYRDDGFRFAEQAIAFWEELLDDGHHAAALGGSDDHRAGSGDGSPIGSPTTLVFAANLSLPSLRTGILNSRTVVKMQGPDDPMIDLDTVPTRTGDTAIALTVVVSATVTGGVGDKLRFVKNGRPVGDPIVIEDDPQTFTLEVSPDESGEDRVRAEVLAGDDEAPRTLTSYVWLRSPARLSGCTCRGVASTAPLWTLLVVLLAGGRVKLRFCPR